MAVVPIPQCEDNQEIQVKEYQLQNQKLVLAISQLTIVSKLGLSSDIHWVQTSQEGQEEYQSKGFCWVQNL